MVLTPVPTGRDRQGVFFTEDDVKKSSGAPSIKDLPVGSRICIKVNNNPKSNDSATVMFVRVESNDAERPFAWRCLHPKPKHSSSSLPTRGGQSFCGEVTAGTTGNTNTYSLFRHARSKHFKDSVYSPRKIRRSSLDQVDKGNMRNVLFSLAEGVEVEPEKLEEMRARKVLVQNFDLRPCLGCSWCDKGEGGRSNVLCSVCRMLKDDFGWNCHVSSSTGVITFRQKRVKFYGIDSYLRGSTKDVSETVDKYDCVELSSLLEGMFILFKDEAFVGRKIKAASPSSSTRSKPLRSNGGSKRKISDMREDGWVCSKCFHINSTAKRKCICGGPKRGKVVKQETTDLPPIDTKLPSDMKTPPHESKSTVCERGKVIEPKVVELPTITRLLQEQDGLSGVLRNDVLGLYRTYFGTNATIAAKIMLCLGTGGIPPVVEQEIPFCQDAGTDKSRFIGVYRMDAGKWGVGIPQFYVEGRNGSKRCIPPKVSTVNNGQVLYLRTDVQCEELAGKLFAFQYKAMYGPSLSSHGKKARRSLNQQDQGPTMSEEPATTDDNEEKEVAEIDR
mmetsp:Transcript_18457/g.43115  ORF Transcript_18457/g.43115 Transcript_18457/m.43115 type:complete len:559 (-) Transcript_18457:1434-3110(-)